MVEEKGTKYRTIFYPSEVQSAISDFIRSENLQYANCQNRFLFTGVYITSRATAAKHIVDSMIRSLCLTQDVPVFFERLETRAGIVPPFRHHRWREYVCTTLVSRNVPIDIVAKWIGHASSSTTQNHYLSTYAIEQRVQEAMVYGWSQQSSLTEVEALREQLRLLQERNQALMLSKSDSPTIQNVEPWNPPVNNENPFGY